MGTPISFNSGTTATYTTGVFKKGTVGLNLANSLASNTNWWNGVDVSNSQYLIYSDIYSQGQSSFSTSRPTAWTTPDLNDSSLILLINTLPDRVGLPGFTTVSQAVNWLNQTGKYFLLKLGYDNIVTSNIKLRMDAGWYNSYPGSGSTWTDLSVNNYSATLYNSPVFVGNDNGVLDFDGANDYGSFGTAIVPAGSSPYTVIVWVKRGRNNVGYEQVLSQWTNAGSGNSFFFGFDSGNVRFTDNWNPITVPGAEKVDKWMCLVGVNTGSNAYIYLNGVLMATRGTSLTYGATGPLVIGRQGELSSEYFDGQIGLIQIYDTALSQTQILQNFYAQAYRYGLYNNVVTSALETYFDVGNTQSYPGSGTNLLDLSGNDRNAVLYNGPTFNSNGYLSFDGTDDYGYLGTTTFPTFTDFTITAFIKIETTANHRGIFSLKVASNTADYEGNAFAFHTITGGYFGVESANLYPGNTSRNNTSITFQEAHISVVCNQSTKVLTYYLNGVADGTENITGGYTFNNQNAAFLFCRQYSTTGPTNYQNPLVGTLYEFNFYPRALSASEIKNNFHKGNIIASGLQLLLDAANPVSYVGTGTTWKDLSGNVNNGTLTNGPTFTNSNGGAIVFDGTNDYVRVSSVTNFPSGDFTIDSWIYPTTITGDYRILSANQTLDSFQIAISPSGEVELYLGGDFVTRTGAILGTNNWYNLIITRSGSSCVIYVNGESKATGSKTSTISSTYLDIGYRATTGNHPFNGRIASYKLYNSALNSLEVQQNFNAYKSRYGL